MKRSELIFDRPEALAAAVPAEGRGLRRDEVRLLVSTASGHRHAAFHQLADLLQPGDLLVVNESATLPASLPAGGEPGDFLLNLSTHYGGELWLAEPRWSASKPGPLPLRVGDRIVAGGLQANLIAAYPGIPRLWFVQLLGDVMKAMNCHGRPIVYGYVEQPPGLDAYQTIFSKVPGSAEMPSAARPFTRRVLDSLAGRGIEIRPILLHTGVSSLEFASQHVEEEQLYPEPFWVPGETARAVNRAREQGRRVIAVGTTVVRALESAWLEGALRSISGFTRLYVHPGRELHVVDGLLTGMHDPVTSHLAMLYALAGRDFIQQAYREAILENYLWHEFGDSHLILPG